MRRVFPLILLAAIACSRSHPSPEYAEARAKHASIVAANPRDAASRPEMAEVLALLDRVPASSPDAASARELRDRIAAERKALADEESSRAAAVAKAGESPAWPSTTSIGAPPPKPAPIAIGMKLDDFRAAHGECFEPLGPATVSGPDGKARAAEAWAVKTSDAACSERYAGQKGQVVLVADGVILAVRPAADAKPSVEERVVRRVEQRDVELVPMAGGKWGIRRANGEIEPVPAGAEVRTREGAPLPPPEPRP